RIGADGSVADGECLPARRALGVGGESGGLLWHARDVCGRAPIRLYERDRSSSNHRNEFAGAGIGVAHRPLLVAPTKIIDPYSSRSTGGRTSHRKIILTRDSTIAPKNAGQKPCTWKPRRWPETSSSIRALITNQKTPSVRIVSGKVMILRKSPSVAFTNLMTSAAISAVRNPLTSKPGITRATISSASALRIQLIASRSMTNYPLRRGAMQVALNLAAAGQPASL